ncbi:MAG: DUF3256 family protein [Prevotellaceae bacterium]|nr:DUF3256 family protein [Prevotellaceae bacterium]
MRALLLSVLFSLGMLSAFGQDTLSVKSVMEKIPEKMIPYLDYAQITELCKFANLRDSMKVKNVLNGNTYVDSISDSFMKVHLNDVSEIELKLLPLNDSTKVICMIKSYNSPVMESIIKFYSTEWRSVESSLGLPDMTDAEAVLSAFTQKPDTMTLSRYNELKKYIEPVAVSACFSDKDENTITFTVSMPMLNKEDTKAVKDIIKQKSFKWINGSFKEC